MQSNKWIDEIHLTQDGGLIKRIYRNGEEELCPEKNQEVTVNYIGRLEDGTIFD
jgi:peptidylprolyl isomerase